jgi:hypothetical protein
MLGATVVLLVLRLVNLLLDPPPKLLGAYVEAGAEREVDRWAVGGSWFGLA